MSTEDIPVTLQTMTMTVMSASILCY